MGSRSENDLRSHVRLRMMGKVRGPGGSFLVLKKRLLMRIDFRSNRMQMEMMMRRRRKNQFSIVLFHLVFTSTTKAFGSVQYL